MSKIIEDFVSLLNFFSCNENTVWCREERNRYSNWYLLCNQTRIAAIYSKHIGSTRPWDSTVCYKLLQWFFNASFLFRGALLYLNFSEVYVDVQVLNSPTFSSIMCISSNVLDSWAEDIDKFWRHKASIIPKCRLWRKMSVE